VDGLGIQHALKTPMPSCTEFKTARSRILAYSEEIGWPFVPHEEAERQRRFLRLPEDGAREMMEQ